MKNGTTKGKSQLEEKGWERKFITEEHRVIEYVELYESLDQEVRVEPVIPSEMEGCSECFKVECSNYRVIYTRRPRKFRTKEKKSSNQTY
ncbi:MAG: hypothetical protein ACW97Z_10525 [Candidatus Hodarchaeales archaeon]